MKILETGFFDIQCCQFIKNNLNGLIRVSQNGEIIQANPALIDIMEFTETNSVLVLNLSDLMLEQNNRRDVLALLQKCEAIENMTAQIRTFTGKQIWTKLNLYPILSEDKKFLYFEGSIEDISEVKWLESHFRIAEHIYRNTVEGIMITDDKTNILKINKVFEETSGYAGNEVIGKTPAILKSGRQDSDFYKRMWFSINNTGRWEGEIRNRRKSGEVYSEWLSITTIKNEFDHITNYIGIFTNINVDKTAENRLTYLAYHDALTGLPNRHLLMDRLEQNLERCRRFARQSAVIFVDLDGFKAVNDMYGHLNGDRLLILVSNRLIDLVRRSDTVARLGGDEFCVLFDDITSIEKIYAVTTKMLEVINQPFQLDENVVHLSASIGASIYPDDGELAIDLIDRADKAMYKAKRGGKSRVCFYSEYFN